MEDTPRYLNLNGSPHGKPQWKTFHQSAGLKAGMLCAAFMVATEVVMNGAQDLSYVATFGLIYPVTTTLHAKLLEHAALRSIFNTRFFPILPIPANAKDLVIDTMPEKSMKDIELLKNAKSASRAGLFMAGVSGGISLTVAALTANKAQISSMSEVCFVLGATGVFFAPHLETALKWTQRFNKVVNGEYTIIDTPPRQQEAPATQLSLEPT